MLNKQRVLHTTQLEQQYNHNTAREEDDMKSSSTLLSLLNTTCCHNILLIGIIWELFPRNLVKQQRIEQWIHLRIVVQCMYIDDFSSCNMWWIKDYRYFLTQFHFEYPWACICYLISIEYSQGTQRYMKCCWYTGDDSMCLFFIECRCLFSSHSSLNQQFTLN